MTIDAFFDTDDAYERALRSPLTDAGAIGALYATDPVTVRVFLLPHLRAVKVSLPRGHTGLHRRTGRARRPAVHPLPRPARPIDSQSATPIPEPIKAGPTYPARRR